MPYHKRNADMVQYGSCDETQEGCHIVEILPMHSDDGGATKGSDASVANMSVEPSNQRLKWRPKMVGEEPPQAEASLPASDIDLVEIPGLQQSYQGSFVERVDTHNVYESHVGSQAVAMALESEPRLENCSVLDQANRPTLERPDAQSEGAPPYDACIQL